MRSSDMHVGNLKTKSVGHLLYTYSSTICTVAWVFSHCAGRGKWTCHHLRGVVTRTPSFSSSSLYSVNHCSLGNWVTQKLGEITVCRFDGCVGEWCYRKRNQINISALLGLSSPPSQRESRTRTECSTCGACSFITSYNKGQDPAGMFVLGLRR